MNKTYETVRQEFKDHHGILMPIQAIVCGFRVNQPCRDSDLLLEQLASFSLFAKGIPDDDKYNSDHLKLMLWARDLVLCSKYSPVGYLAACAIDDRIHTGWSLCNALAEYDKFDRRQGIDMAIRRAMFANTDRYQLHRLCDDRPWIQRGVNWDVIWPMSLTDQAVQFGLRCYRYYLGIYPEDCPNDYAGTKFWDTLRTNPVLKYDHDQIKLRRTLRTKADADRSGQEG